MNDSRSVSQIDLVGLLRNNTEVRFPPSTFRAALLWLLLVAVSIHVIGTRLPSAFSLASLPHDTPTLQTAQAQADSLVPMFTQRAACRSDSLLQRPQQNSQGTHLLQTYTRAPSEHRKHTLRWLAVSLLSPVRLFLFRRQAFPSSPADDPFSSSSRTRLS